MNTTKVRITWNGQGGELDSRTVTHAVEDDQAVARALAGMVGGQIVSPGDSFTVESIESN